MSGILFVHNNFPAQFAHLAAELVRRGERVAAISSETGRAVEGVELLPWAPVRAGTPNIFRPARWPELDLMRGRAAAERALTLKAGGFEPDLIIAHPYMGGSLFLKDIFPKARHIAHGEYYYRPHNSDADFDPEFAIRDFENDLKIRAFNATLAWAYAEADAIVCPTPYQLSLFPPTLRARARIIHEGVDTNEAKPDPAAWLRLTGGQLLDRKTPVITYVSRRFEPMRGVHILLRALPKVLAEVPEAQVLMIGADHPDCYGVRAPAGTTWKQHFLKEMAPRLDLGRVHFTGTVSRQILMLAFAVSAAHVYYTYPFVLSWSLLEAMACGCLVVGSDTPPLHDAIQNGRDGLLLDFFDVDALSDTLIRACRDPDAFASLRENARKTIIERFDRADICLPQWMALIEQVRHSTD